LEDKESIISENNIVELKKAAQYLNLDDKNVEEVLKKIKPEAFRKNLEIYRYAT